MRRTSRRLIAGATLSSVFGAKTSARTTLWVTGAHNDGSFYLPATDVLQRSRDLRESQFGVKEEATSAPAKSLQLAFGGGVYFDRADFFTFENSGRFFSPLEEEFNAAPRTTAYLAAKTSPIYAQATWHIAPRFP